MSRRPVTAYADRRAVELALWVSGRRGPAQVTVSGSPEAIDAFQAWAHAA